MAVDGWYMARRAKGAALRLEAYCECWKRDVIPVFINLEKRAAGIADAEFNRLLAEPVGEDWSGDGADLAEAANEKALYDTMAGVRQSLLNLIVVGLFHLTEQELANLCREGSFTVPPPKDSKLSATAVWYREHFHVDLSTLASWPVVDEMRLVANSVKHAEGSSAHDLRALRRELFEDPASRRAYPELEVTRPPFQLGRPLAGEDLYVTEQIFQEYCAAAIQLVSAVASHFQKNADDIFPY